MAQYRTITVGSEVLPDVRKPYWATETRDGHFYLTGKFGLVAFSGGQSRLVNLPTAVANQGDDHHQSCPVVECNDGYLWGTTQSRLYRYDPKRDDFRTFTFALNGHDLAVKYRIVHHDLTNNLLWVTAGNILWTFRTTDECQQLLSGDASAVFYDLSPSATNLVGVSYNDQLEVTTLNSRREVVSSKSFTLSEPAYSVAFGAADSIVYLGTKSGLVAVSLLADTIRTRQVNTAGPTISLRYQPKSRLIWQVARKRGVYATDEVTRAAHAQFLAGRELSGNDPRMLSIDRNQRVWVSQYGLGYDVIQPLPELFTLLRPTGAASLVDATLTPDGNLMVIDDQGVVYVLSPQPGASWNRDRGLSFRPPLPRFHHWKDQLYLSSNLRLAKYQLETNWRVGVKPMASTINGLFLPPEDLPLSLTPAGIRTLTFRGDSIIYKAVPALAHLPSQECVGIFQLGDDDFLLSFRDQEIWRCRLTSVGYQLLGRIPLSGDLNGAVRTQEGGIFLALSSGLYRLVDTVAEPLLKHLPSGKRLSFESITETADGHLLLGTSGGLVDYDPAKQAVRCFGTTDGLPSTTFLDRPPLPLRGAEIGLLSDAGLVVFDPQKLQPTAETIHPYVTGIWVNNLVYEDSLQTRFVTELTLPYRENTLNFAFAVTGLGVEADNMVEYQLIDYDIGSQRVPTGQSVRYPQLPPGQYTLQLTAINHNGLPSGKRSLRITIASPFWQTWWFYLLCTCVLAFLFVSLYFAGLRRERLRQQRLSDQQARLAAERDRIAGEVHDDLGGQLSSILYLSEEMLLTGESGDNKYPLQRINELSRHSLQNVRDIIFALDNRRASLADLGEQLRSAGTDFFNDRGIDFAGTNTFAHPDFSLTSRQKRNLILIVKEAWHNTAKHANASLVTLDLREADGKLQLTCSDNGRGFATTRPDKATGGYGLDNMTEKAAAIGATAYLESAPGNGTTLRVCWPIQQDRGSPT